MFGSIADWGLLITAIITIIYTHKEFMGYKEKDGHNTSKIMRALNAFYLRKTELNGIEPMPIEVFKQRKKVIEEMSKLRFP